MSPIPTAALRPAAQAEVSFDAFFTYILMHELIHALGPNSITVNERQTTVKPDLKQTHRTIEEAKADIAGLWAMHQPIDQGAVDQSLARSMYTNVAGVNISLHTLLERSRSIPMASSESITA